jgi:uncharacterized protein YxeA
MKKIIATALIAVIIIMSAMLLFNKNVNAIENSISEVHYTIQSGENDAFATSLISGEREKEYSLDGIKKDLKDFTLITVNFKNDTNGYMGMPRYKLDVAGESYTGDLEKNNFNDSYYAEIYEKITDFSDANLQVNWDGMTEEAVYENVNENWQVDWALAYSKMLDEVKGEFLDGNQGEENFAYESHIKIIEKPLFLADKYLWYAGLYGNNGTSAVVAIDPITGEIITKNINVN